MLQIIDGDSYPQSDTASQLIKISIRKLEQSHKLPTEGSEEELLIEKKQNQRKLAEPEVGKTIAGSKFYIIVWLMLAGFSTVHFFKIFRHADEITTYLHYLSGIMGMKSKDLELTNNLLYGEIYEQMYNRSLDLTPTVINKTLLLQLQLSEYFDEFTHNEINYYQETLCVEGSTDFPTLFDQIECLEILQGILGKGYIQSKEQMELKIYQAFNRNIPVMSIANG